MRIYVKDSSEIAEVKCNCCGQTIKKIGNTGLYEDYLHIEKNWNYFSSKDLEKHDFDLCEACYDKWCSLFVIPIGQAEVTEVFDGIEDELYLSDYLGEDKK